MIGYMIRCQKKKGTITYINRTFLLEPFDDDEAEK
jgi:hypothetical protein